MQELLGRMRSLDASATASLRVIACFDELMAGAVGTDGLLSAAAALSGHVAGVRRTADSPTIRVDGRGDRLGRGDPRGIVRTVDDLTVWLEADHSDPDANEAIIVERLGLALRVRYDLHDAPARRDLAVAVDPAAPLEERVEAAIRRGLSPGTRYRAIAAPLFAIWNVHPHGPEDVVATAFGPVHVAIVSETTDADAMPLGIGIATTIDDLELSFRTATVALRLADGSGTSTADDLGGVAEVLADMPTSSRPDRDEAVLGDVLAAHPWAARSIEALSRSTSVREAARTAGIHHSTMTARIATLAEALGFDPLDGMGRTRLTLAYFKHRLRSSRVLELPPPGDPSASTPR